MLRRLRYFQSVVRLNSFSQAAEENYISQSAISQQIQALEKELGSAAGAQKSQIYPHGRRRVFLSEEPEFHGGI